jgi:hypothetical protein
MSDEYQTRQFFNMRPETTIKLKRIIKEEVRDILKEDITVENQVGDDFLKELTLFAQKGEELLKRRQENGFKK